MHAQFIIFISNLVEFWGFPHASTGASSPKEADGSLEIFLGSFCLYLGVGQNNRLELC